VDIVDIINDFSDKGVEVVNFDDDFIIKFILLDSSVFNFIIDPNGVDIGIDDPVSSVYIDDEADEENEDGINKLFLFSF